MKILDAKVDWVKDYDNHPNLVVLVDKMPDHEELVYNETNNVYYAIKDGYVSFFFYERPGEGYGGREFPLRMTDGTTKILKGPWSSRAGAVNSVVLSKNPNFEQVVDVTMTASPDVFYKKNYTYYASAITLPLAIQAAKLAKCHLIKTQYDGDTTYYPSLSENFIVKPRNRQKSKPTYKRFILNHSFEYKTLAAAKSMIPTKIVGAYTVSSFSDKTPDCAASGEQSKISSIYPNSRYNSKGDLFFVADNGKLFTPSQAAVLAYAFGQIPSIKEKLELSDIKG